MAAYANTKRAQHAQLRIVNTEPAEPTREAATTRERAPLVDQLLGQLADLVADRLATRLAAPADLADEWLDTRNAADYLGVHRDTIRRLAAERAVPTEQEGPGCKLYFRRSDLAAWRCSDRRHIRALSGGRA
jgi:excisionase family DNA binding protein